MKPNFLFILWHTEDHLVCVYAPYCILWFTNKMLHFRDWSLHFILALSQISNKEVIKVTMLGHV